MLRDKLGSTSDSSTASIISKLEQGDKIAAEWLGAGSQSQARRDGDQGAGADGSKAGNDILFCGGYGKLCVVQLSV